MDLYSFADGDPLNNFDADGRFASGGLNGAGMWASQSYASGANALDAVIKPFANLGAAMGLWSQTSADLNWNGGAEADFRYARNFELGSDAYRMGHQFGYAAAEIGFQVAMTVGPAAFGRMASTAAAGGGMSAAAMRMGGTMSYGITRAAPAVTPNAIRERVLANLAESAKARQSSNFDKFLANERRVSVSGETAVRRPEQLDLIKQDIKGHWWGVRGDSGQMRRIGNAERTKDNGNSLDATGPHDVYAIRDFKTGDVLHIGETGRGFRTRFREHQLDFAELGINIKVTHLKTVEGKAAARALERQYIQHYERALGARPRYNLN